MASVFDYLDWRGDLRFSEVEPNEVDGLILSLISYMNFDGIVPTEESEGSITLLETMRKYIQIYKGKAPSLGKIIPPDIMSLSVRAAKTRRFSGIRLMRYVNDVDDAEQIQFSAMTYKIGRDKYFVSYRGTDDTLVGWKENFNMSFMQPVPAQQAALEYFESIARQFPTGTFYLGGHSKGGNLAVYAASKTRPEVQDMVATVFNNDGPGFDREFIEGEDYWRIKEKIRTIIPQSSVVGMLLEHEENYEVIKSNAGGLLQHNGFTWEVMGGSFIHLDTVTEDSRLIDGKLKEWLGEMSAEEREAFVDSVYETMASTNAKTLTELSSEKVKLVKAWGSLDAKTRNVILKCISILIKHNAINIIKK